MSNSTDVTLSRKYQLVENVKILGLFTSSSMITLFFGCVSYSFSIIRYVFNKSEIVSPIGFLVSDCPIKKI